MKEDSSVVPPSLPFRSILVFTSSFASSPLCSHLLYLLFNFGACESLLHAGWTEGGPGIKLLTHRSPRGNGYTNVFRVMPKKCQEWWRMRCAADTLRTAQ